MSRKKLGTPLVETEYPQPDTFDHTCPKTGHVVPLPADHGPGRYTLFDDKGKVLHKGMTEHLTPPAADAETAEAQANSEDASA